jgi:hypothetical protein
VRAAFVAANLPKEQRVIVDTENFAISPLDAQSHTYRIVLIATGKTSGRQIAKNVCVAKPRGRSHRTQRSASAATCHCRDERNPLADLVQQSGSTRPTSPCSLCTAWMPLPGV